MKTIKLLMLMLFTATLTYAQSDSTTSIVKTKFRDAVDSTVYNIGDVITLSLDRTKQIVNNVSKIDYLEVIGNGSGSGSTVAWADITGKPGTATSTTDGFMSAAQFSKLQGIEAGATSLTIGTTSTTAAAGNHTHAAVTGTTAGFMTAAQKAALNALTAIADPTTATAEDIANKVNEIIAALKTP